VAFFATDFLTAGAAFLTAGAAFLTAGAAFLTAGAAFLTGARLAGVEVVATAFLAGAAFFGGAVFFPAGVRRSRVTAVSGCEGMYVTSG